MYRYLMIALLLTMVYGCERVEWVTEDPGWHKINGSTYYVVCANGYAFLSNTKGITQIFENTDKGIRAVQCVKRAEDYQ